MTPFKLTLELKTNMLLPDNPICLDALMASVIDGGTSSFEKTIELLDRVLKKTDGIYHASSMIFGTTEAQKLIATTTTTVRLSREETDLCSSSYNPGANKQYKKHKVVSGELKNQLKNHRSLWSPYIIFYGCGDAKAIKKYLDFSLFGVGKNANRKGSGSVGRIYVRELDKDVSLVDCNGKPNRPLPETLFKQVSNCTETIIKPKVRTKIPYFDPLNTVIGVTPMPVRIELQTNADLNLYY